MNLQNSLNRITSGQHPELFAKVQQINNIFRAFALPGAPDRAEGALASRVAPLARQEDFECLLLGGLGFSNHVISRRTGLSNGQIYYRLKAAGIDRRSYRDGKSAFAIAALERVAQKAGALVTAQCRYLEHRSETRDTRLAKVVDV